MLAISSLFHLSLLFGLTNRVLGQTSYANDFVDPDYIVAGNFPANTGAAQRTIIKWATTYGSQGPWSVMNKPFVAPSGDKHDYMSFAPYWWPDCSGVGNTTELPIDQVWKLCTYKSRDGQFNPDVRTIDDVGGFQNLSDAVLYNVIAWKVSNPPEPSFAKTAVTFIKTWFLDDATRMNPNLNYAQMQRGPDGQNGSHTGILDLKCMTKIVSAILILRKSNNTDWTLDMDNAMNSWSREYISWLETASISIEEMNSDNNHGTFFYNQLASLKILVGDTEGAKGVTGNYFSKQYMSQIQGNGEQPLEAARTRPYHYRAYNLAAMITNARLDKYANSASNVWNKTTTQGANIKTALDFALTTSASTSKEDSYAPELYPNIAAVASVYGDSDGKYLNFLKNADPSFATSQAYPLWNQPFALDLGEVSSSTHASGHGGSATKSGPSPTGQSNSNTKPNNNSNSSKSNAAVRPDMRWTNLGSAILVVAGIALLL